MTGDGVCWDNICLPTIMTKYRLVMSNRVEGDTNCSMMTCNCNGRVVLLIACEEPVIKVRC